MPNENLETLHQTLMIAQSAVQAAGHHIKNNFRSDAFTVDRKGNDPKNLVTSADKTAEEIIISVLKKSFPDDGIISEESEKVTGRSGRIWHLDPLDGTTNFTRGIPIFAVSLGLFDKDQPLLGIIHQPINDETYSGIVGKGAWLNNQPITCTKGKALQDCLVAITTSNRDYDFYKNLIDRWIVKIGKIRIFASAALSFAYTAAGFLDGAVGEQITLYDAGGGMAIVKAAGGTLEVSKNPDGTLNVLANIKQ